MAHIANPSDWRVGDRALHVGNHLDSRPVAEILDGGRRLRLQIGDVVTDPVPAANYLRIPANTEQVQR